jgi:acyl-homoserine lactone acylase PvdQ
VLNPKQGYVASANNKVAPIEYPHSILYDSDWEEPFRAKRIIEMIEEKAVNMTVEHMMEMQADVKRYVVESLKEHVLMFNTQFGVLQSLPQVPHYSTRESRSCLRLFPRTDA